MGGLYLFARRTGTLSWLQRIVTRGRWREFGLVTLAEAREMALANRKLARFGGDMLSEKRRAAGVLNFTEVTVPVLEQKRGGWRGRWHAHNWWRSLELRHESLIRPVRVPLVAPIVLKWMPASQGHQPRPNRNPGCSSSPVASASGPRGSTG